MALLGTYGGADDVRLLQNRILAEQAGALIPEGGGGVITYPGITLTSLPVLTVVSDTSGGAGQYILNVTNLGTVDSDDSYITQVSYWANSNVGTSEGAVLLTTLGIDETDYRVYTKSFPEIVRPAIYYALVTYETDTTPPRILKAYTRGFGTTVPSADPLVESGVEPVVEPTVRTASTKSTRKAVTV